ncbi:MAG: guanylate kinase [Firmicutes bacterium]|nr:guanylate kinase [Bacillota bacterium]MBR3302128.1 guanylate kinase [Bacillota bacterium]MBR6236259.1 guanylate kinase [Bacillota bacterium]
MKQGRLFVISGPSGAGKGTICKELISAGIADLSVSMTTRKPRGIEQEGVHYYFVSHEEFQQAIDEGNMLEWAEIYANRYGTPKKPVLEKLAQGRDVILEIEMQGAMQVKKSYPKSVLIFVLPPSISVLRKRLIDRGTETPEQIDLRTRTTLEEIKKIKDYSYFIINDDLASAVDDALTIINAEHLRVEDEAEDIIQRYEREGI